MNSLCRDFRGVVLALSVTVLFASVPLFAPAPGRQAVYAEEIDCEDRDNFDDPDCVQRRQENPSKNSDGTTPAAEQPPAEAQPAPESAPSEAAPAAEQPYNPTEPSAIVLGLVDAGKEATQFVNEEGSDNFGRWARTRFERDRSTGASRLGPNVIETKAWVAKDLDAAKALFKAQAAIKTFPERKEATSGINDKWKFKPVADESSGIGAFWDDDTVWHHYRIVARRETRVSVLYLFGRADLFQNKDKTTNGLVEWFSTKMADRL